MRKIEILILDKPRQPAPTGRERLITDNLSPGKKKREMSKNLSPSQIVGYLFFGIVFILLLIYWGPCGSDSQKPSKPKPKAEHDEIGAWVMCQEFVKDKLKSPGSADFGGLMSGNYQRQKDHTKHLGDGVYKCTGWVDAQNAFGAKIRNNFTVTIKYMGKDQWRSVEGPIFLDR